jgi:hypothetical protein
MLLRETLDDFHGCIGGLASYAPDEYSKNDPRTYKSSKQWVMELWSNAKPRIKRNLEEAAQIDQKLKEAFELLETYQGALDRGETPDKSIREKGRDALWVIYNMQPGKLR